MPSVGALGSFRTIHLRVCACVYVHKTNTGDEDTGEQSYACQLPQNRSTARIDARDRSSFTHTSRARVHTGVCVCVCALCSDNDKQMILSCSDNEPCRFLANRT